MTELERYLAEEVAEDHVDGIITRREAMRRLGLLGRGRDGGVGDAGGRGRRRGAAKGGDHGHHHHHGNDGRRRRGRRSPRRRSRSPGAARKTLMAAWAPATKPRGGVLVIHENRGLTRPHPQRRGPLGGERLVGAGARPALRGGRDGVVPGRGGGRGEALADLGAPTPERFDEDMKAARHRAGQARRAPDSARRDRLLLRRRHDLAPAGRARAAARGGRAVLRPVPDRREPEGQQGGRARHLRGRRHRVNATPARRRGRRSRRRGSTTSCSRSPAEPDGTFASVTRSSTTPARASTRRRPRRRGGASSAGSTTPRRSRTASGREAARCARRARDARQAQPPCSGARSARPGPGSPRRRARRRRPRRRRPARSRSRCPAATSGACWPSRRRRSRSRTSAVSAARTSRTASAWLSHVDSSRRSRGRGWKEPIRRHTTDSPKRSKYIRPSASPNTFDAP